MGKVDWMAFGLPVEGSRGPWVSSVLVDVATCGPDDPAADVVARLVDLEGDRIVVVDEARVVLGTAAVDALRQVGDRGAGGGRVLDVLEPSPQTIRPSVEVSELNEHAAGVLVTTPEGVLMGAVDPEVALQQGHHAHG